MSSRRFVISTLNGMFISQLATWVTAPGSAAILNASPASPPAPALLSRADDDAAHAIDDEWQVVIPVPGGRSGAQGDATGRLETSHSQGD